MVSSDTPVREALTRLEQVGLVARADGWDYRVRAICFKEAMDEYNGREALDVEAAREVLPRLDQPAIDHLKACLMAASERLAQRRLEEFRENTRRFHRSIFLATESEFLASMLMTIEDRIHLRAAMLAKFQGAPPQQSLAQNDALLDALERLDEEAAIAAVKTRVSASGDAVARLVMSEQVRLGR